MIGLVVLMLVNQQTRRGGEGSTEQYRNDIHVIDDI